MSQTQYEWDRAEERALARYAQPATLPDEFRLPADINRLDLLRAVGTLGIAGVLYAQLLKQNLQYELAPYSRRAAVTQLIRGPATILAKRRGACLDLAVLFAAMCLESDLLPLIVVVEGYAFAGLSRTRTRPEHKRPPKALAWDRGKLTDLGVLRELTGQEYAWVECAGAAASQSLATAFPEGRGRDASGRMSFERACDAGSEQIRQATRLAAEPAQSDQREFLYALDIQDLQVNQGFEPVTDDETEGAGGTTVLGNVVHGDQRNIDTAGGQYYEGPITVNDGDFVAGNKNVTQHAGGDIVGRDKVTNIRSGDEIRVGNITGSTGVAIGRGAQATVTHGVEGQNVHIDNLQIYQGVPTPLVPRDESTRPEAPLTEEHIRLDVAAPNTVILGEAFDLAAAVRQLNAPPLVIAELTRSASDEGTIFRAEGDEIVKYRIEVFGSGFEVAPPYYLLKLRPGENSHPCFFQITPRLMGKRRLVVNAFQADGSLAAQTPIRIDIQVSVRSNTLASLFANIYQQIDARPPDATVEPDEIKDKVRQIQQEAQKQADASEPKLQRWLGELAGMAPDIFDVTVAALSSPMAAVSAAVRTVAEKAKHAP